MMKKRHLQRIAGAVVVVVLLESISFAIGRELGGGDGAPPAAAASTPTPGAATSPGATATPAAPEVDPCTGLSLNPDATQPFGAIPYRDRDRELPLFDGVIAGLRIGPDADAGVDQLPKCSKTRWGTLEEASGSPLELPLTLPMPAFRAVGFSQVVICEGDGLPLGVVVDYAFGAYSEVGRYGGSLSVSRTRVEPRGGLPVVSMLLPAPRVREMEIAGGPAAVAVPILPDHGAGTAAVVTYRDGIITVIQGNAPIGLLLEVSEYILRGEW